MRELNQNEKVLAGIIAVLLVLFMIKNLVIAPVYEKIDSFTSEIDQSKMIIRKYIALEHNRMDILKAQKQIEGYTSLKGSDEDKSSIIMSKIEAEARKAKLQILDMNSMGASKVKGAVTLYRINLRSEGQLKNILDFISAIEGSDILLQIEKIALSSKDETGTVLKMDATVLGVSFS